MPAPLPVARPYHPELNGLRAVAVVVVVAQHWLRPPFPLGELGPALFFVLSGYLISGIVWEHGAHPGAPGAWARRVGTFYGRRALRILPLYYLALAGCALLPLAAVREHPGWFVLPGANLLFYRLRGWPDGVGPYWTVAVELQFYLLWPWVLGWVGRRRWPLLALAAAAWGFRAAGAAGPGAGMVHLLLPASLDLFAAGALLRRVQEHPGLARLARGRHVLLAWGSWAVLRLALVRAPGPGAAAWTVSEGSWLAGAGFLTLAWLLRAPAAGRVLRHPVAQWLGTRSYGAYLLHLPLLVGWQRLVYHLVPGAAGRAALLGPLPVLLALGPALVLLSAAAWHWVEAPVGRLKNRLRYAPAGAE